jgi:hypothetical protein
MAKARTRPHVPLSTILVAVGCVVVVLVVVAVFYWVPRASSTVSIPNPGPPYSGSMVEIQDYELMPAYNTTNTSDTSFLESQWCPSTVCPIYVGPGNDTLIKVTLEDNDTIDHKILNVTFDAPFTLVETVPSMPLNLTPYDPTVVELEIQVPTSPAIYDVVGTINTN